MFSVINLARCFDQAERALYEDFIELFCCKKKYLSRRVGYVMDEWFSGLWFSGSVRDVCMSHQSDWIYY